MTTAEKVKLLEILQKTLESASWDIKRDIEEKIKQLLKTITI